MKKAVKSLIIASSVAAIAGIGAVSFAAWSQGSTSSAPVTGNTGSIVTMGTLTATSNIHGEGAKKLVPYNQVDQYSDSTMTKFGEVTLQYPGGEGNPIYKIQLTSNNNSLTLKYKVASTTPTDNSDFVAIPTSATQITVNSGDKVYIILESDSTDDMNKAFTVTFTAEAPTA